MRTAVVILNWNTESYLRQFVPGVIAGLGEDDYLYVADSASTDASLEWLQKEAASNPKLRVLPLDKNYGFAGGYDRALAQIPDAEYYLLLNSDIETPAGWLAPLVDWMDKHPECGVCGPKLHALLPGEDGGWVRSDRFEYAGAAGGYIDRFGYPYCRGRVLEKTETDCGQYDEPHKVFWVSGAALMIRRSLWAQLGGLDEEFFAHMEEIDLCWRAQLAGSSVWTVPSSTLYHIGGGTLPKTSPWKLELNFRNSLWMLRKNLPASIGPFRATIRIAFRRLLDLGSALVYLLSGKKDFAAAVIKAHKDADKRHIVPSQAVSRVRPSGVCILLTAAIRGNKVFEYLKRYEDCH